MHFDHAGRMRIASAALLATLPLALFPSPVEANGGGFFNHAGWTGDFSPRGTEAVEILSEDLEIRFGHATAQVAVTYRIRNAGTSRAVRMGFPCTWLKIEDHTPSWFRRLRLEGYEISLDGKDLDHRFIEENAPVPNRPVHPAYAKRATWVSGWEVSRFLLPKDTDSTLSISFRVPYTSRGHFVSDDKTVSETSLSYILSSAAAWKGPIREGRIRLVVETPYPDEFSIRAPKDRFEKDGNTYTWTFRNLEPTAADDLVFSI